MKIIKRIDRAFQFAGKIILYVIGCLTIITICICLFMFATEWGWPEFNGSYFLGKNIYMIEWDGGGRVIVQGSNIRGNTCYGGSLLIPTYENQFDSAGHFAEYVVDAKANDNWIIAKTDNRLNHQRKYYIINKQHDTETLDAKEIIESYITSFTDSCKFAKKCQFNGIKIKW